MQKLHVRNFVTIAVVLSIALTSISTLALAASTTKQLSSNFTLVNLSDTSANVNIKYYKPDGSELTKSDGSERTDTVVIGPNSQVQFRQYDSDPNVGVPSGRYSVVVNSSSPLGSVVQLRARNQVPTSGAYTGTEVGSPTFYVPLVARNGNSQSGIVNSQIIIQNTDLSRAVTVKVDLIPIPGYTSSFSKNDIVIQPNSSFLYDIADESNITAPWFGSAKVSATSPSDVNLAVISNIFMGANGLQTFNAFSTGKSDWVAPFVAIRLSNTLRTVVTVQNLSGVTLNSGDIKLICTHDVNSPVKTDFEKTNNQAVENNASFNFNGGDYVMFPTELNTWYGSCSVSATHNSSPVDVVMFVQIRYVGNATDMAAYEGIPSDSTDTIFVAPMIAKRLSNGFSTVATIQNMSTTTSAHVDLIYTPSATECPVSKCDKNSDGTVTSADTITVENIEIAAGASIQRNHRLSGTGGNAEPVIPDGWVGSLRVETHSGATVVPISGFIQLTFLGGASDSFMAHNAFTLP